MKILGIDDDEDTNKLMKDVLESQGHDFTSTNNGQDGIKLIREQQFDLVFLDIVMPGFSGQGVINVLVKDGIIKKQPVILFTASSITDSEIQEAIKKGVHSCIRKPFDIDIIIDVVNAVKNLNA